MFSSIISQVCGQLASVFGSLPVIGSLWGEGGIFAQLCAQLVSLLQGFGL